VTVTVPYDEGLLPAGIPEENVALVYWDGSAWVTVQGTVDTSRNTVTVQLREFDGVVLATVAAATLMTAALGYLGYKLTRSDPIIEGRADTYIKPNDSKVKAMARFAMCGGVSLADRQALVQYMESLALPTPQKLAFTKPDGMQIQMEEGMLYDAGPGTNWQMPNDYFDKDMRGDCTDVTNAMVSVFRSLGYEARGVFGYQTNPTTNAQDPHAWGEVLIGGKVYLIDEQGQVSPREAAMELQHLTRPEPGDARYYMWDDVNRQKKQDPDWYKQYLTSATTSTTTSTTAPTTAGTDATEINGTWIGQERVNGAEVSQIEIVFDISAGGTGSATRGAGGVGAGVFPATCVGGKVQVEYQGLSFTGPFTGGETLTLSASMPEEQMELTWTLFRRSR
jgi:hypothetical protein